MAGGGKKGVNPAAFTDTPLGEEKPPITQTFHRISAISLWETRTKIPNKRQLKVPRLQHFMRPHQSLKQTKRL